MSTGLETVFLEAHRAVAAGDQLCYEEKRKEHPGIVRMIIGEEGLLHVAVHGSRVPIIEDLLKHGADPDAGSPSAASLAKTEEIKCIFKKHREGISGKNSKNRCTLPREHVLAGR